MIQVELEIECEGQMHRIVVSSDRTLRILDHDERMLRAFSAFGAKKPECMKAAERFEQDDSTFLLLDILNLPLDFLGRLSCDFVERVLPVWERQSPMDADARPRNAVTTAYRYWDGEEVDLESLKNASEQAAKAEEETENYIAEFVHWRTPQQVLAAACVAKGAKQAIDGAYHDALETQDGRSLDARREHLGEHVTEAMDESINAEWHWANRRLRDDDEVDAGTSKAINVAKQAQLEHVLRALLAYQKSTAWPGIAPVR